MGKRKQAVAPACSICCTRLLLAISHLRLFGLGSGAGPGRRSSTAASDDRNLTQTRTDCQRLSCVLLSISFGPTEKKSAYRPIPQKKKKKKKKKTHPPPSPKKKKKKKKKKS